jgi:hypothetical protein
MLTTQDRTPPENAELLRRKPVCLAVHPPYSPDLAPSDFFLFERIKYCLQEIAFPSREDLLAAMH